MFNSCIYFCKELRKSLKDKSTEADERDDMKRRETELKAFRRNQALLLVKDVADVHYAASTAELGPLRNKGMNRGVVAIAGVFSSIVGIQQNW